MVWILLSKRELQNVNYVAVAYHFEYECFHHFHFCLCAQPIKVISLIDCPKAIQHTQFANTGLTSTNGVEHTAKTAPTDVQQCPDIDQQSTVNLVCHGFKNACQLYQDCLQCISQTFVCDHVSLGLVF